jgi:streptogramin lyase
MFVEQAGLWSARVRRGVLLAGLVSAAAGLASPVAAAAPTLTEFALPGGSGPRNIVAGSDGNLWFTHNFGVSRITPNGTTTVFGAAGQTGGIAAGPDGNVWFTDQNGNQIGRITPAGTVTKFPVPTPGSEPAGIGAGPDGNLWFTERLGTKIGRITPTGTITEFPVPTANSTPWGITGGPDGNVWFTELSADRIGRITPAGAITEFPLPAATRPATPRSITTGADGNLWFTEMDRGVGRITPSGAVTEFNMTPPTLAGPVPTWIASGPDGNLWATEWLGNKVAQITPAGAITEFPLPSVVIGMVASNGPSGIATGPDGNIWFTEELADKIGRLTLDKPARPLAHFQCYAGDPGEAFKPRDVTLRDQFGRMKAVVSRPQALCAPARKNKEPKPANPRAHLACYSIEVAAAFRRRTVVVANQFQRATRLRIIRPVELCLPAGKSVDPLQPPPAVDGLDHFECYKVKQVARFKPRKVTLRDQFGRASRVVARPRQLCNPVSKNRGDIVHPTEHLVCYAFRDPKRVPPRRVSVVDQFRNWLFTITRPRSLCVPSVKS